jgi:hypothetical protein
MKSIKKNLFSNKKSLKKKKYIGGTSPPNIEEIMITQQTLKSEEFNESKLPKEYAFKKRLNHNEYQEYNFKNFRRELIQQYFNFNQLKENKLEIHKYKYNVPIDLNLLIKSIPSTNIVTNYYEYNHASISEHIYVDFANKQLGGAFLTYGYAQEEIIFYEFIELFLAVWKELNDNTITMEENEVIVMTKAKRIFKCNTYGRRGFETKIKTLGNDENSLFTHIPLAQQTEVDFLAIDAIKKLPPPKSPDYNYFDNLVHMFNKAYIGFKIAKEKHNKKNIHTGEWGAGVFFNNPLIMYYLQVLAASAVGELKLTYYIKDDNWYSDLANKFFEENIRHKLTISQHLQFLKELDVKLKPRILLIPVKTLLEKNIITGEQIIKCVEKLSART